MRCICRRLAIGTVLVVVILTGYFAVMPHGARGDETVIYYISSESVVSGTSDGFGNEMEEDGLSNVKQEVAPGTVSRLLKPDGDVSVDWDYVSGSCVLPPTLHYGTLVCPNEPDGNTSYVTSRLLVGVDVGDLDRFDVEDPSLPVGAVITNVSMFMWLRANATVTNAAVSIQVADSSGTCWPGYAPTPTLAFTNYTWGRTTSCDGNAWTTADISSLNLLLTASLYTDYAANFTATYAGVIVTYYSGYVLDFTSVINIPSEQVQDVVIVTEGGLTGDYSEGFVIEIGGSEVTDNAFYGTYTRLEFSTSLRGEIQIRMYDTNGGDLGLTILSLNALYARVISTGGGGGGLKPPVIECGYNAMINSFDCVDVQDYGSMSVQWVRWQIDDQPSMRTDKNGRAVLSSGESFWDTRGGTHLVRATAVYLSGAEVSSSLSVESDNTVKYPLWAAIIGLLFLVGFIILIKAKRKR